MNIKDISNVLYNHLNSSLLADVPVAALILDSNDNVISIAKNSCIKNNPLYHAEIIVINDALKNIYDLSKCTLVTSLEPCLMCYGAALNANIKKIIYFARNLDEGAFSYFHTDTQKNNVIIEYIEDLRFSNIIKDFFKKRR